MAPFIEEIRLQVNDFSFS